MNLRYLYFWIYEYVTGCDFFFFFWIKSRLCKHFNEDNRSPKVGKVYENFFVEQKQVKQVHKLWVCAKAPKRPK